MKIALSIIVALFMLGCSGEEKETTSNEVETVSVKTEVVEAEKSIVEGASALTVSVEETTAEVVAEVQEKAIEIATSVENTTEETITEVKEEVLAITTSVEETIVEATKVAETTPDATVLYNRCASCHGTNGEKQALGKSAVIQGWSKEKILDALNGYEDGTYGAALKGMMKSQAENLNAAEKEAISEHISKF